jgi:hypothetical protein
MLKEILIHGSLSLLFVNLNRNCGCGCSKSKFSPALEHTSQLPMLLTMPDGCPILNAGMNVFNASQQKYWAGVMLLLLAAGLYMLTLDTGLRAEELVGGDLITHQYAQIQARPSNAPGYPLYTMGGWAWFHSSKLWLSGLLNPVQRLSAYSLLWGVAGLAMLYLILLAVTDDDWPVATLLTAFHAVTFFFWYYSVTTEQYSSAVFQTLLLIWLAFRWDDTPRDATLLWMAFVSGTMLANMVTTLFILPSLLWFIFSKKNGSHWPGLAYLRRPGLIVAAVAAALLPLMSYAYIFLRGAQHPEWRGTGQWNSTWDWFIQFVTIRQGRDELAPGLSVQALFTSEFPALVWQELTLIVFLGGLAGLLFLGRRRAVFLGITLLIYFVFCWSYRFGNWFQVIIPAYPIFTIGFGALLAEISRQAVSRLNPLPQNPLYRTILRHHQVIILVLLTGLILYQFTTNFERANQHNRPDDNGLAAGWAILADSPEAAAIVISSFEERLALEYLAAAWNIGGGLTLWEELPPASIETAGPLYITRQVAGDGATSLNGYVPQAAGEQLIRLYTTPIVTLPATAQPAKLEFGDGLTLAGWETGNASPRWQIALFWQATGPIAEDYTISIRPLFNGEPVTVEGQPVIQDHAPIWGVYHTNKWEAGSIVKDFYAVELPAGVTPTALHIVVYHTTESGFENLADHVLPLEY